MAEERDVGLIAMGWEQNLDPPRARAVRQVLCDSPVPVLLVPVSSATPPVGR